MYEYGVNVMQGPVAFGTDFNGISQHNAPRFGAEGCAGQTNGVAYPFTLSGLGTFGRQETGGRQFDFNTDGLAHIGLLPDMVQDLKNIGLSDQKLEPLFQSAEAYIRMWEAAGATNVPPRSLNDQTAPTTTATLSAPANGNGWHNANVVVTLDAVDDAGGSGVAEILYVTTGAQFGVGTAQGTSVSIGINTEGTTTVVFAARDADGNQEAAQTLTIKLDKTAPTITGQRLTPANAAGWNSGDVQVGFTCSDAGSGIAFCSNVMTLSIEGANQAVTGTATDRAGNSASFTVGGINIDRTPPVVTTSRTPPANAAGWNNTDVTVTFDASDALSGLTAGSPAQRVTVLSTEGANQSASLTVSDLAGNSTTSTAGGINIDKTPPVVTVTGVAAGAVYSLGAVPTAGCNTTDALSGVATSATPTVTGGTANNVGEFTAACRGAADRAGNTAETSVVFYVHYIYRGFFSPIANPPVVNNVKAGRSVPVKFSLGGNHGLDIFAPGSPTSGRTACSFVAPSTEVLETVTPGSSSLSYDVLTDKYHYNWKTDKSWTGTCRRLIVTLDDGTTHEANFCFK
jgi:hypothetical protein